MTVKKLKQNLKGLDDNAEVFLIKDWDQIEDGILTDRYKLLDVCHQTVVEDQGLDFEDIQEVLLCFDNERF